MSRKKVARRKQLVHFGRKQLVHFGDSLLWYEVFNGVALLDAAFNGQISQSPREGFESERRPRVVK
jgi:hypothetical protein